MISKSPDRNTFQKERYLERKAQEGKTPENDEDVRAMAEYYDDITVKEEQKEADPNWAKDNMEYDMRTCEWMVAKVRASESYAQNLYAAMCNNDFQKLDVIPILKNQRWSCSWRYAGGIVAHMRGQGDYIDWYCSGIRNDGYQDDLDTITPGQYVSEMLVTEEIRADLKKIGWVVADQNNDF